MREERTVLVAGELYADYADTVVGLLQTDWTVLRWHPKDEPIDAFREKLQRADVIVAGPLGTELPPTRRLKLFQIPFTGHDWITPAEVPRGCLVCNDFEHEAAIAEFVLLGMLEWEIGLSKVWARFRDHGWEGRTAGSGPTHGELFGKTVGIVCYGHIGREVAIRAAAFGNRVIAVAKYPRPTAPPLDWYGTADCLDRLMAESDYVVVACLLSEATKGLIGADEIAAMKPTGVLINVARGVIIDEPALYEALREKRIGGAIIDVWYRYPSKQHPSPPPSRFPFHELDNIIMTPHFSGWTQGQIDRRWRFVAANLDRFHRGEPVQNLVFEGTREAA